MIKPQTVYGQKSFHQTLVPVKGGRTTQLVPAKLIFIILKTSRTTGLVPAKFIDRFTNSECG